MTPQARVLPVRFLVGAAIAAALLLALQFLVVRPGRIGPLVRRRDPGQAKILPMTSESRSVIDGLLAEARKDHQFQNPVKAIERGEFALKMLRERAQDAEVAALLIELGEWYAEGEEVSRAGAYFRTAYSMGMDRQGGQWPGIVDKAEAAHRELAFKLSDRGDDAAAMAILDEMLEEFRKRGDWRREAQALHNQGWVVSDHGRQPEARKLYWRALAIRQDKGDAEGEAWTTNNIGVSYLREDDFARAGESFLAAMKLAGKRFPQVWEQAASNIASLARRSRELKAWSAGMDALEAVVPIVRERDELRLYEFFWLERMECFRGAGDFDRATFVLDELMSWERRAKYSYGAALCLFEKGCTLATAGKLDDALVALSIAGQVQSEIGDVLGASTTRERAGRLLLEAGRTQEALESLREALEGFEGAGPNRDGILRVIPDLAAAAEALGLAGEAERILAKKAQAEALPARVDLDRFMYIEGCEGREGLIAGMRLDDALITIRRIEGGWQFVDHATGREVVVPFSWANRPVVFQGKDFRLEGPIVDHFGVCFFLSVGQEAAVAVNGTFYRVVR